MPKEMIISVNGREKKIAIIDNGNVTEFYIERGEDNSGLVGNIYKGKVQRVLPGMQSAFVEVGLERDAFLYVSDFFDEEEEIERILVDKTIKKQPTEEVEREVTEHLVRARLEREHQMEAAQEKAEPLLSEEPRESNSKWGDEAGETLNKGKRSRSRRGRKDREDEAPKFGIAANSVESDEEPAITEFVTHVFEIEDSGFERIVDEDGDIGEIFKDAYRQESIVDVVRAVEFEMESTSTAEVGSILENAQAENGGFERIADDDDVSPLPIKKETFKPSRNSQSRRGSKPPKTAEKPATESIEAVAVVEAEPTASPAKPKGKKPARTKKVRGQDNKKKAEASIGESSETSEMTVRRGGRRRRSTGPTTRRPEGENGKAEGENPGETIEETPQQGYQGSKPRRNDRNQPTITDLLREGQEIMVQIAKEPIARKGARITSHIALPGRYLVYMPTIEHVGVSRKIESSGERSRLRTIITRIRNEEDVPSGGFIVRTAGIGVPEENLREDARYLVRTWKDIKKSAEKAKSPALVHQDLDLIQRILRDQLSDDFTAIRVDSEEEYLSVVEFVNRIQPKMVNRVKLYTRDQPILEAYNVQEELDKALKSRVWLRSGGYLVINQTEALVAIDVNTGKFVGKGNARLEDTITKTNMEAVDEIARQIRLRDLGGIIVLDLIDMEDRRNRHKVLGALQDALQSDKSPTKVLSFNDFGLVIMTRKRVKQSLERTMCSPCPYCSGSGLVKSDQTVCYEILEEARRLSKGTKDVHSITLRVNPDVLKALRGSERVVLDEVEAYLGAVDLTSDSTLHQENFDFAFI